MSAEEQKEYNVYPKLNVYQVFNVAQTNLKAARPELYAKLEAENKPEKALVKEGDMYSFPAVDRMFKEQRWICPINIEHQDNAFYSISRNQITIPEKSQFKDGESWYGTAFHEMVHSTGAEDQLNRLKPQSGFGSDEYAREELVAELGSASEGRQCRLSEIVARQSEGVAKFHQDHLDGCEKGDVYSHAENRRSVFGNEGTTERGCCSFSIGRKQGSKGHEAIRTIK